MENSKVAKKSKGKIAAAVVLVIVLVLGGFGVNYYINQKNYVTTDDAKVTGDILNASSKIPGKVLKINVANGQQVKKGDVLFSLETDMLQDQMNQAQAALDVAKAQLAKAVGGARAQEIAGAQAGVDQAQSSYNASVAGRDSLQTTLNDVQNQYNQLLSKMSAFKTSNGDYDATNAINQLNQAVGHGLTDAQYTEQVNSIQQMFSAKAQLEIQLDQLKGQLNTLNSQVNAAKAAVDGANSRLSLTNAGASDKDLAIIEAQVKAAQVTFDLAQLNFNNSEIKAPADGTVVQINIHEGDMIGAGQAAVSLVNFGNLQITANVLESDLERINPDQKVTITVDSFPGTTFTGTVKEKGLATSSVFNLFNTENASGNYTKVSQRIPVKINFDTMGKAVIPGMSVEVKIKVTK